MGGARRNYIMGRGLNFGKEKTFSDRIARMARS